MTEEEERRALLARIVVHEGMAEMDFSQTTLDGLRWLAGTPERGAVVVRQKGRMAAMCYGVPDEDEEPSDTASGLPPTERGA